MSNYKGNPGKRTKEVVLAHRKRANEMRFARGIKTGSAHGRSVLNEKSVYWARCRYAEGGITHKELAKILGCHHSNLGHVLNGITWKYVGGIRSKHKQKRRQSRGNGLFNEKQVRYIREQYELGVASTTLSEEYSCSTQTIIHIGKRKSYRWVR